MTVATVLYPKASASRFDYNYYLEKHIPMVKARCTPFGLERVDLLRGTGSLDGSAFPFELIGSLSFTSPDAMRAALEAHGAEILGDIPNFTDVEPMIQVGEPIGS